MTTLQLLMVEDSEDDALLLVEALREGGFAPRCRRVETESAFRNALAERTWDLVIADFRLPHFSGLAAARIVQESRQDIPLIMVSGKVGEEHAVEAMRAGAADYLLKGNFARLVPAVERELQEVRSRRESRYAEQRYQLLFETMLQGVIYQDAEGAILSMNPAAERILGRGPDECLGETSQSMERETVREDGTNFPGSEHPSMVALHTGQVVRDVVMGVYHPHEEQYRWINITAVPLFRTGEARPYQVYAIFDDITERKQAEQELRLLSTALGSTVNGVVITDRQGEIIWVNPAFTRLTGYSRTEVLGQNPRLLNSGRQPIEFYQAMWKTILSGEPWRGQLVNRRKDGTFYTEEMTITPVRAGGGDITHFVAIKEDISERKHAEELREDILRTVSHDLRAPLAIIQGHTQLLGDALCAQPYTDTECESIKAIMRSVQRMNVMIQDLVDAARFEGGQLHLKPQQVSLDAFLHDLLRRAGAILERERIHVEFPEDLPFVLADYDRLERILVNLLTNALKYSDPGTPVRVEAQARDREIVVSVTDQGQGIPPDDQPQLFQRFYRAKATGKAEGLGLGLFITRMLVEAHGGCIWVESEVGKGSAFHFSLPKA